LSLIATAALSILTSGLVSALVTFRLSSRRQDLQFRRQKLEDTYKAFIAFAADLGLHWMPFGAVMAGRLEYKSAIAMTKVEPAKPRQIDELQMLVAIYFPELQPLLDELLEIRDRGSILVLAYKSYESPGQSRQETLVLFDKVLRELQELRERFALAVRAEAEKIRSGLTAA